MRLRRVMLGSLPLVAHFCSCGRLKRPTLRFAQDGEPIFVVAQEDRSQGFTAMTSISTSAPGAAKAATCMAERAGLFGWSLVPKNWV